MRNIVLAVIASVLTSISGQALAIDEPENIVKYRQAVMGSMQEHFNALAGIVKGEVSFTDNVATHARGIDSVTDIVPSLFPPGTGRETVPDSRALPGIWENESEFQDFLKTLQAESAKMVEVAESGDMAAITAQAQALGKACGDCHRTNRAKRQ
ncbi:MAG TPA: cytochrome c [Kiloniellales bacterium]|nr:cytochrome c [Kiloniellales bacterium]